MKAGLSSTVYANVNPESTTPLEPGTERRIGEFTKRKTLMLNGYADQVVASLYGAGWICAASSDPTPQ